jgi:hypothetical protein
MKRLDSGLLITLILCGFALLPLARQDGLAAGYDVLYHTYRVAEMDRSWDAGLMMPRWADSFYFGYGYPVFHYYASSSYYLTSLMIAITGIDAITALRILVMLSLLGGGAGMYLFGKQLWGRDGGILGALTFVYSPYIIYTEPYARGDFPELLAFALIPWILWRFERLKMPAPSRPRAALRVMSASVLLGVLVITHNLMAVVFFGMLVGWLGWQIAFKMVDRRTSLTMMAAAALGIGLAAYFWIPVLLESDAVQLENLIDIAELDYRNFFVPIGELFGPSFRADAGAVNGLIPRHNLGVASWLLALVGGTAIIWNGVSVFTSPSDPPLNDPRAKSPSLLAWRGWGGVKRESLVSLPYKNPINAPVNHAYLQAGYFGLLALLMIFLMTPGARFIWDALSPLALLQFPWRFLGPVALCLAIISGATHYWLEKLPPQMKLPALTALFLLPLAFAIPTLYIPQWDLQDVDTSVAAYQQAEVQGLQRGTTFTGEYLPVDVFAIPGPTERLLEDFADGGEVDHAHYEVLPEGVELELIDSGPQHTIWRATSVAPFGLEVLRFDFPGWEATINGQSAPITPAVPHGFITFEVPAGESLIKLELNDTPPRRLGKLISLASLLMLIGLAAFTTRTSDPVFSAEDLPFTAQMYIWGAGMLATVIFFAVLVQVMRPGRAWYESEPGEALAADHAVTYHLGEAIDLIGYDISDEELRPGDRLDIALYWYATQPPQAGYASFIHITTGGPPNAQSDILNPGGIPTLEWRGDGYIYDPHTIILGDDMPPGTYEVRVGLWTCDGIPQGAPCGNGIRPDVTDQRGDLVGDSVPLTTITIK